MLETVAYNSKNIYYLNISELDSLCKAYCIHFKLPKGFVCRLLYKQINSPTIISISSFHWMSLENCDSKRLPKRGNTYFRKTIHFSKCQIGCYFDQGPFLVESIHYPFNSSDK